MNLSIIPIAKTLNKAYLKQSLKREQLELFKGNLARLFDRIRAEELEEHLKNIVADFLKDTWYKPAFEINTSKRADLVIHNGKSSDDTIGVIIETKKPSNKNEMISDSAFWINRRCRDGERRSLTGWPLIFARHFRR